jgi:hypothetical protein
MHSGGSLTTNSQTARTCRRASDRLSSRLPPSGGGRAISVSGGFRLATERHNVLSDRSYRSYSPKLMRGLFGLQSPGVSEGSRFLCTPTLRQQVACDRSEQFQITLSMHVHSHARSLSECANTLSESEKRLST